MYISYMVYSFTYLCSGKIARKNRMFHNCFDHGVDFGMGLGLGMGLKVETPLGTSGKFEKKIR